MTSEPQPPDPKVIVVGHDGESVENPLADSDESSPNVTDLVEQPAKVMRIGSMIKQLLEEVRDSPLDEAARERLREVHARSVAELQDGLAPELVQELERLSLPFGPGGTPSPCFRKSSQRTASGKASALASGSKKGTITTWGALAVVLDSDSKISAVRGRQSIRLPPYA